MLTAPERWLPVVGYEGRYEVSDLGRVRSLGRTESYSRILNDGRRDTVIRTKNARVLSASRGSNGYLTVRLLGKTYAVHRVVLQAFVGPRPAGYAACHNDGQRLNNGLSNLRWDTYAANSADRVKHGFIQLATDDRGRFLPRNSSEVADAHPDR